MKLQYINSFLKLYKTQNMTQASELLYITQQGLSRQIMALEKELDATLFIRKKNGMIPTELSHQLYPEFKKIANSYNKINHLCSLQKQREEIRIVAGLGLARYIDYDILNRSMQMNGIQSFIMEEHSVNKCIEKLSNNEADFAFLLNTYDNEMITHVPIMQTSGYAAMTKDHPLASHTGPLSLAMLDEQNIVSTAKNTPIISQLEDYFIEEGIRPNYAAFIADNISFINNLQNNDLIVLILKDLIPRISNDNIIFKEVVNPSFIVQIDCCYLSNHPQTELFKKIAMDLQQIYLKE